MFGIGMPEMFLILALALIVIGPKKLPDLAKSLGRALGEFKKATNDLKQSMEIDTGIEDVKRSFEELNQDVKRSFENDEAAPVDAVPQAGKDGGYGDDPVVPDTAAADVPDANDAPSSGGDPMEKLKHAFDDLNSPAAHTAAETDADDGTPATPEAENGSTAKETGIK